MGIGGIKSPTLTVLKTGGLFYLTTILGLLVFNGLFGLVRSDIKPADVIVVLGGGQDEQGHLSPYSKMRLLRGIDLYQRGLAPRIAFSGGSHSLTPNAEVMARIATQNGIPSTVIITEGKSLSTLQNALFSSAVLPNTQDIILVTDGYHLPRSWVSFKWAGFDKIQLVRPDVLHDGSKLTVGALIWGYMREGLAIWFNIGRLALYEVLKFLGVEETTLIRIIA